jgi:hypothetical protein
MGNGTTPAIGRHLIDAADPILLLPRSNDRCAAACGQRP